MNPEEELQLLNELLDELTAGIREMLISGEKLSDEFQSQLADEISFTMDRITELNEIIQDAQAQEQQERANERGIEQAHEYPAGVDLLWILSGGQPEAFIQYLQTYPNDAYNTISRNPSYLHSLINKMEQLFPQGEPQSIDGVPKAPLNSSNIWGFKYNPKTKRLLVRFQGGSTYGYEGVPLEIFNIFSNGAIPAKTTGRNQYGEWWRGKMPSLGAAFYELIRLGGFPYQRLN